VDASCPLRGTESAKQRFKSHAEGKLPCGRGLFGKKTREKKMPVGEVLEGPGTKHILKGELWDGDYSLHQGRGNFLS